MRPGGALPLEPLGPDDLDRIHAQALRLLADVGTEVHDDEMLERLAGAGQRVDGTRVRWDADWVLAQLALAPAIRGDLLFHYAEHDNHIPLAAVDRVRSATCTTDRPGNACHVYPGTQHGFNCWERGSYHAGASALALGRSLQFLAERLF